MLSFFRRLSKSKGGAAIGILFLVIMLASFAVADVNNFKSFGSGGFNQGVLAKVGKEQVTEAELSQTMQRQLAQLRQQKPDATYADLAPQFEQIVNGLIQAKTLKAYAIAHGMMPPKKAIDAEIVKIPATRGLDGRFSEASYAQFLQQQRLTDAQLRDEVVVLLLQRMLLAPVAANMRMPLGVARPYASMLLEEREGQVAVIPSAAFKAGAAPTDAELQAFYAQNRNRYVVPEQRVLRIARISPETVAGVQPTDQEIAAYYQQNAATYAGGESRVLSRASIADQNQANQVAARAKAGGTFAAAAQPAGFSAADVSLGPQSRADLTTLAGPQVAAAVFAAPAGAVVGPIKSSTGYDVIKVERIDRKPGKSLAEARPEIIAKLAVDKRKSALTDLVAKVEDGISENRTFDEVAQANKLPVTQTPPLVANGQSMAQPTFQLPPEYKTQLLKDAFSMQAGDDPLVETLANDAGYAVLALGQVTPATPAPLAQIRDRVAADFLAKRAEDGAKAAATAVLAKVTRGMPLAQAIKEQGITGAPAPAPLKVRRIQLAQLQGQVPAPLQMLFSLTPGKSRMVAAPQGQGFFIVQLAKTTPGDALGQPGLITQTQSDLSRQTGEEIAVQFLDAAQKELGVSRNEAAIAEARKRLLVGG
ncbi:peptidyl-prolyl cis-trans isomerase [Sphingomonas sp. KRR8]|uniref:peptidyl-prolyl cis-trans isomerase n=1 Tax=Sphingomonas sp. KRR8 TaxID=2942996 RepID=UPI002020566A|nr:peptidyl-prolyl cis-trans isomerase [Sphingomonas sp. KRR8]URD62022.1 peptidyl-prolyl cis-trans isomerase [Sphingomonas sp. KRR8]